MIKNGSKSVVADIAWSHDCQRLLFAAGESIIAVEFEEKELGGKAVSREQMNTLALQVQNERAKKKLTMSVTQPIQPVQSIQPAHTPQLVQHVQTAPAGMPSTLTPQPSVSISRSSSLSSPAVTIPVSLPSSEPKKRENEEPVYDSAPVTRKRKKQLAQTPAVPSAAPSVTFPAMAVSLPYTTLLHMGGRPLTLSLQCFSLTNQPFSEASPDETVASLIQVMDDKTLVWSWCGQGRVALLETSAHMIACVTKGGLLHLIGLGGRTLISPVHVLSPPSALAITQTATVSRLAVITESGWMKAYEFREEILTCLWECCIQSLAQSAVQELHTQFTQFEMLFLSLKESEQTTTVSFNIDHKCVFPATQFITNYSLYSHHTNTYTNTPLSTAVSTNVSLVVSECLFHHA